jgi:hypothetical protein
MIKIAKNTAPVLVILILLVFAQIAGAQSIKPIQTQLGKLIDVVATGNGPDANGRYEYEVSIEILGQTYYFKMWMTKEQAAKLKKDIGKHIYIDYKWVNGKRIYIRHGTYMDFQHEPSYNYESGGSAQ